MQRLPDDVVMGRGRRLHAVCKKIWAEKNEEWVGWKGEVLVDERGKEPGTFVGRNFAYKPIVVSSKSGEVLLGNVEAIQPSPNSSSVKPLIKPSSSGLISSSSRQFSKMT